MSQQASQNRWQWMAIAVLTAGLFYILWQSHSGVLRIQDAAEELIRLQDQLGTAVTEQQEATQRVNQVVQQVDAAYQGIEEAQDSLDRLQQRMEEQLAELHEQLEPAIAGQQAETRRLGQLEDQVFMAMTRQQTTAERLTEVAGQVEAVAQELREARAEIAALAAAPSAAAVADVAPAKTWTNTLDMAFVLIPAGAFEMGSEHGDADEQPVRPVTIDQPFYIAQFEVTQAQWFAVMESDPSQFSDDPNRPVEGVSWNDAQEFINKLNLMEPDARYRLPTEAEWEYAARAGSTAAYAFGDDAAQLDAYAWYVDNAGNTTHPVGGKQPNAWDVHAMHGGVWEWVQNRYGPYPSASAAESAAPPPGNRRVIRGGSWLSPAEDCRAASRSHAHPAFRGSHVGFRLVRTIP